MSMMKKGINTMPGVTIGNALRANRNARIALDWRDEAMRAKEANLHNYNELQKANGYIEQQQKTIKQLKARIAELQNKVAETEKKLERERQERAIKQARAEAFKAQRDVLLERPEMSRDELRSIGLDVYDKEIKASGVEFQN